ncbi:MAG: hypothetical protein M9965_18995 [Anaerolineae bacterium]|nr:hypothetical protein [Anaerolineae bacterium]
MVKPKWPEDLQSSHRISYRILYEICQSNQRIALGSAFSVDVWRFTPDITRLRFIVGELGGKPIEPECADILARLDACFERLHKWVKDLVDRIQIDFSKSVFEITNQNDNDSQLIRKLNQMEESLTAQHEQTRTQMSAQQDKILAQIDASRRETVEAVTVKNSISSSWKQLN